MRNFNWGVKLLWKYFLFIFQKPALPTGLVPAAKLPWVQVPAEALSGSLCRCSVAQSCLTLCDPMDRSTPGLSVHHQLPEFIQTHVRWVGDAIQPSHHLPALFPFAFSFFPSIRVFSTESALHIGWPKYWSFSFSISPSKEYSALISFRMDWFDLLAVQGTLKSLPQHHSSKSSLLQC